MTFHVYRSLDLDLIIKADYFVRRCEITGEYDFYNKTGWWPWQRVRVAKVYWVDSVVSATDSSAS